MNNSKNLIIILIAIIAILIIALTCAIVYIFMIGNENADNRVVIDSNSTNPNDYNTNQTQNNTVDDVNNSAEELAIQTFNSIFEVYLNKELTASQIRTLFSEIESSNTQNLDHNISLSADGITTSDEIDDTKTYKVELSYDDIGYINEVTITDYTTTIENGHTTSNDLEKINFNSQIIPYSGRITGAQLYTLLQTAQASNNANPEHQITLTSSNLQSLNQIVQTEYYIITLSYDTEGYVNNINIDKEI